jgi:ParB family chromosome partitioning protein
MAKVQNDVYAGLFGEQLVNEVNGRTPSQVSINDLYEFEGHTYKVQDDDAMEELSESIKQSGIIEPLIVRKANNGYEIISGHRRQHAAELAGLQTVPVHIVNLSDDEAVVAMVDTNLKRPSLLPSEMAYSFKAKYDALKHMGVKDSAGNTAEQIGESIGKSGRTVERYIRLTYLIKELMDMTDNKKINVDAAVILSFLQEDDQYTIYEFCVDNEVKPSKKQAQELKECEENLTYEMLQSIFCKKKPSKKVILDEKKLNNYFPKDMPFDKKERIIIDLLEKYKKGEM